MTCAPNCSALFISLFIGAWLNSRYGWRMTFFAAGIPALVAAVVVRITVREPRSGTLPLATTSVPSARGVAAALWSQRSSRHLCIAISLFYFMALGITPWYAAFMMRSHGMTTAEVGTWLGLILGISGTVGILMGGWVGGRWYASNYRGQMRLSAVLVGSLVPFYVLFLLLPRKYAALAALMPLMMAFCFFVGPAYALLQQLVPDEMRATTAAIVGLLSNLIGMGIGPQIVGILSDTWHPRLGSDSLRYAMLTMSFVALWSAWHFWRVGRTVESKV